MQKKIKKQKMIIDNDTALKLTTMFLPEDYLCRYFMAPNSLISNRMIERQLADYDLIYTRVLSFLPLPKK